MGATPTNPTPGQGSGKTTSAASNPTSTSGSESGKYAGENPPQEKREAGQRTGPGSGNQRGNDLPSQGKTQRDTRTVEGGVENTPGRGTPGSEVSGSDGFNAGETPED